MEFEERDPVNERPRENDRRPTYFLIGLCVAVALLFAYGCWDTKKTTADQTTELIMADTNAIVAPTTTETVASEPVEAAKDEKVTATTPTIEKPVTEKPTAKETEVTVEKPKAKVASVDVSGKDYTYTVGDKETFLGIANRFNLKYSTLQSLNPGVDPNAVQSGSTRLKVRIQGKHTVGPGDILRVVAEKYGVSVQQIMDLNHKEKNFAQRGEVLLIPIRTKQ